MVWIGIVVVFLGGVTAGAIGVSLIPSKLRKIALEDNLRAHREFTDAIKAARQARIRFEEAYRALEESTCEYKISRNQYQKALETKRAADAEIRIIRRRD